MAAGVATPLPWMPWFVGGWIGALIHYGSGATNGGLTGVRETFRVFLVVGRFRYCRDNGEARIMCHLDKARAQAAV